MSLSRADLEAMDREALVETLLAFDSRLEDLETDVRNRMTKTEGEVAMRQLADAVEADVPAEADTVQIATAAADELRHLRGQLDTIDATMPQQQRGKRQKVRSILEFGVSEANGVTAGVKVTSGEAAAAASCSRDTARRLMDEIGTTFEWAGVKNPGGPKPKELRLTIENGLEALMADVAAAYDTANGGEQS
jgi:hypothetical protein